VFPRGMRDRILTPRCRHAAAGQSLPFGDSPLRAPATLRRARLQPRERIDNDALANFILLS